MTEIPHLRCANPELTGFNARIAAEETFEALLSAGVFVEGDFTFASGLRATLKADTERLYSHPRQLAVVMGHFATFPCVQNADALLYVPNGMRKFMTVLGNALDKPVVEAIRKPGAKTKYEFEFKSAEDKELAYETSFALIGEDVVTTLGSVAGMRRLMKPEQSVHSLAILLRGIVEPEYKEGLVDHYLLEREIPTDKDDFRRKLREEWF